MRSKTGFVYHESFLEHDTGPWHPEKPDRLRAIVDHLKKINLWEKLHHLTFTEAPLEVIRKVHSQHHISYIKERCKRGFTILDQGDTTVCEKSYNVALLAVGGVIAAVDAVMKGVVKNVFCAVRPPGHHAESSRPMGFCLFNNVAIAARYVQDKYDIRRIAIIDWDVHHGNGTQEIFYNDPSVLFISIHQFPFYPGTGANVEKGEKEGEGYTLNLPVKSDSGEKEYFEIFKKEIVPSLTFFHPEFIIISAGFDAHENDPLAKMKLTCDSYKIITNMILDVAEKYTQGRVVSVLEGGYDLRSLSISVQKHIEALMR